ncbi:hypothetical protein PR048_018301 [Dryococelus australis]|uniref:Uncharacterized protein n=1 Tax=Dryococelus australis TaxID=614101 RepID=A0ABQ9HC42_9NEOP|nr:hypothetical protein PR048_018301 [Dryococelus australis]
MYLYGKARFCRSNIYTTFRKEIKWNLAAKTGKAPRKPARFRTTIIEFPHVGNATEVSERHWTGTRFSRFLRHYIPTLVRSHLNCLTMHSPTCWKEKFILVGGANFRGNCLHDLGFWVPERWTLWNPEANVTHSVSALIAIAVLKIDISPRAAVDSRRGSDLKTGALCFMRRTAPNTISSPPPSLLFHSLSPQRRNSVVFIHLKLMDYGRYLLGSEQGEEGKGSRGVRKKTGEIQRFEAASHNRSAHDTTVAPQPTAGRTCRSQCKPVLSRKAGGSVIAPSGVKFFRDASLSSPDRSSQNFNPSATSELKICRGGAGERTRNPPNYVGSAYLPLSYRGRVQPSYEVKNDFNPGTDDDPRKDDRMPLLGIHRCIWSVMAHQHFELPGSPGTSASSDRQERRVLSSTSRPADRIPEKLRTGLQVHQTLQGIRGESRTTISLLASHQGEPGSVLRPGNLWIFACGNRGDRCRWSAGFLGDLPFSRPFIPAPLATHLIQSLLALKTLLLGAAQISSLANSQLLLFLFADLPCRSRLVRHRSGVREALGSNPRQGMASREIALQSTTKQIMLTQKQTTRSPSRPDQRSCLQSSASLDPGVVDSDECYTAILLTLTNMYLLPRIVDGRGPAGLPTRISARWDERHLHQCNIYRGTLGSLATETPGTLYSLITE